MVFYFKHILSSSLLCPSADNFAYSRPASANSFSPELLFESPSSPGRCSAWCVRRSLPEVLETEARARGSNHRTKELDLLGMVRLLIGVGLKGNSTPRLPSVRTASLQNKLRVQTKAREERHLLSTTQWQAQLSRRLNPQRHLHLSEKRSTSGSAPKTKGSRLGNNAPHLPLSPSWPGTSLAKQ